MNAKKTLDYGPLTDMIGVELRLAQSHAERVFHNHIKDNLLPGHLTVLVLIHNNPGLSQSAIATAAGLDRSSLVPVLKNFEKEKLIRRKPSSTDKRSNVMTITPRGEAVIEQMLPQIRALENDAIKCLGRRKYTQLISLLKDFRKLK